MGYDNVSLSHFIEPKLTTMDQNMMTLGWTAASLLMEKIASIIKQADKLYYKIL